MYLAEKFAQHQHVIHGQADIIPPLCILLSILSGLPPLATLLHIFTAKVNDSAQIRSRFRERMLGPKLALLLMFMYNE